MASKDPRITVEWTKAGPVAKFHMFEHLSPGKIEKCFEAATKEWYRLRAISVHERKKREREEALLAGAENG